MNHVTHLLISAFFIQNQQILLYQKKQIDCILTHFHFFESLKIVLIKMVIILMMSTKVTTLLKINIF